MDQSHSWNVAEVDFSSIDVLDVVEMFQIAMEIHWMFPSGTISKEIGNIVKDFEVRSKLKIILLNVGFELRVLDLRDYCERNKE